MRNQPEEYADYLESSEDDENDLDSSEDDSESDSYAEWETLRRPAPAHLLPGRPENPVHLRLSTFRESVRPEDSISVRGSVTVDAPEGAGISTCEGQRLGLRSLAQPGNTPGGLRRETAHSPVSNPAQSRATPTLTLPRTPPRPEPTYERERPFYQHAYYDDLRASERGLPFCCCQ